MRDGNELSGLVGYMHKQVGISLNSQVLPLRSRLYLELSRWLLLSQQI